MIIMKGWYKFIMMNYIKEKSTVEMTNRSNLYPDMMLYSYLVRQGENEVKVYEDTY